MYVLSLLVFVAAVPGPHAGLDDAGNHLHLICAVLPQPLLDNSDDTLYIVGNVVGAVGGRNLKPLQNGAEDVLLQFPVPGIGLHAAGIPEGRPVNLFVVPDKAEIGEKIFPGDQNQLFPLPAAHIAQDLSFLLGEIGEKAPVDHLQGLIHQIGDSLIVQVEGGPVHAGLVTDLLHRNIFQISLLQQCDERLVHPQGGVEIFAFGLVHLPPSSRGYSADSLISRASCMISKAYFSLPVRRSFL